MPKGSYWETFLSREKMMGKININRLSSPDPVRTELQRDVKSTGAEAGLNVAKRTPVAGDKLDISSRATEVGRLVDQIKTLPDTRQARIDALKEQIAAGSYQPSSELIADAILQDDRS